MGKQERKRAPFQSIADAAKTTGLSMYFIRKGCRSGDIPCIESGSKYMVNMPALFRKYGLCFGSGEYTEVKPEKTGGAYGQKNNRLSGEDSDG